MVDLSNDSLNFGELNLSSEPGALWNLTPQQKSRVADLLDGYLSRLENGLPPSRDALLDANPDLVEPLKAYFESLDELHGMAAGFQRHTDARPTEGDQQFTDEFEEKEKRLGDFRILREIGRGGMGVVYEAEQISMGRRVALKVLPFAAVLDSRQIARFQHEAQAAGQLNHPNIVGVFAVGVERGVHFYAMQYIDGQPLDRALAELRERRKPSGDTHKSRSIDATATYPAPPGSIAGSIAPSIARSVLTSRSPGDSDYFKAVMRLGIQAATAIDAAHQCGIVHRDIKPSNLLLDGYGKLWVTDFGLARRETDATLTRTGDLIGTIRYMSPEQATGQNALIDHRTDIYSLGATLYELLTLEPVFAEYDGHALLRQIELQDPQPPRKLQPRIPVDLQTVVLKAMAKRREDRYMSGQAFADDLQRVLEGRPTVARPPSMLDRMMRWSVRHREIVSVACLICFLTLLGFTASSFIVAREQKKNFEEAKMRFHEARKTVEKLGLELSKKLADVPGAGPVRHELLRQTLGYYKDFVNQHKDDPELRTDIALTYSQIGTLSAQIGSNADAIDADKHAIEIFKELSAANSNDADSRRSLGVCQTDLGWALAQTGKSDESRDCFEQGINLQEKVLDSVDSKDQQLAKQDLARAHGNRGLLQNASGDRVGAEASFARATSLLESLVNASPDDPDRMRDLAAALNNLGSLNVDHDPAKAIEHYEKAAALERKATALRSDDATCRSELTLTYNNLGAAQLRKGDIAAAVKSYSTAVERETELVQMAPAQKSYRHTLAIGYNNLGLAQNKQGRGADAEASFRRALALEEELVVRDPHDVEQQSLLGAVYNNLGSTLDGPANTPEQHGLEGHYAERQKSEALKAYELAVEHQRQAFIQAPDVAKYRQLLSKHYYNYALALRQAGRSAQAAKVALERRELWPHNPQHLFKVAEELALTDQHWASGSGGELSADECGKLAIETLKQAKTEGWKPPENTDWTGPFAAIRHNADFLALANFQR